jgi:predicted rRNA methylase YqxC with S4 and FtsJ domains
VRTPVSWNHEKVLIVGIDMSTDQEVEVKHNIECKYKWSISALKLQEVADSLNQFDSCTW